MLPLIPILLVLAVLTSDAGLLIDLGFHGTPTTIALLSIVPTALIVALATIVLWILGRHLDRSRRGMVRTCDRVVILARWLVLLNYLLAVLSLDWLGAVRGFTGQLLLVDELLVMVPPIVGLSCLWWSWYPIEHRLHEAALLERLDRGLPIHLPPGRWAYVLTQLRLHVLLMLVPMLLILALAEGIEGWLTGTEAGGEGRIVIEVLTGVSALVVLVLSPLLAKVLLSLQPLPEGLVRSDMQDICDRHRVRVRNIMLWRTRGTMINAAVMGLLPKLRYLMLTDGLLEQVPRSQVQAVMAHEVGHVRRHHMVWLLVCLLATVALADWLIFLLAWLFPPLLASGDPSNDLVQVGLVLVLVFILFGWVSRRFERQADTFAVQHLSHVESGASTVTRESVESMGGALRSIAALHAMDPRRSSWRHGSIAWRCRYLQALPGQPVSSMAIDRLMFQIRIAAACILALTLMLLIVLGTGS